MVGIQMFIDEGLGHSSYVIDLAHTPVPDGPVTVMCGHGERAMTGASILTGRSHRDINVLDGGPDTWSAWSGQPLAAGR